MAEVAKIRGTSIIYVCVCACMYIYIYICFDIIIIISSSSSSSSSSFINISIQGRSDLDHALAEEVGLLLLICETINEIL